MKTRLLILLLLIACPRVLWATHIVGGDLTYTYLGNNQYKFTLHLYRECSTNTCAYINCGQTATGLPNNASVYFFHSSTFTNTSPGNSSNTLTLTQQSTSTVGANYYSPCLTYPSGLCVEQGIYSGTITLTPIAGGYTAIYQNSARNSSIINFDPYFNCTPQGSNCAACPAGACIGSTYKCIIPGTGYSIDNSPTFVSLPPTAICQGIPFSYDCSATDADGDNLVYSLATPFNGTNAGPAAFDTLGYTAGYSLNNMVGGTPAMAINSSTGLLTCTPTTAGRFIVGIRVDEYRGGVYIGTVYRDFQFNVTACFTTVTATIPNTTGLNYILSCNSKTITFQNTSSPINGNLTTFWWNFGDPTTFGDTSKIKLPTYTYPDTGTYTVTFVLNPGQVGSCSDTTYKTVKIYNATKAGFKYTTPLLCSSINFTDTSTAAPAPITYKWTFGDGGTSNLKNPIHAYATGGNFTVKLVVTSVSGCKDSVSKVLTIPNVYPVAVITAPALNCNNNSVQFTGSAAYNYRWNFGDLTSVTDTSINQNPLYIYPDSGAFTVTMSINPTMPVACRDTTHFTVHLYAPFHAGFYYSPTTVCINTPMQFTDTTTGKILPNQWFWKFGDGGTSTLQNPNHTYAATGNFTIKLVAQNSVGCKDSITKTITILPPGVAVITAPPLTCTSNTIPFQAVNVGGSYAWDFGDLTTTLDSNHIQSPAYTYPDSGVYNIRLILNPGVGGTCTDTAFAQIRIYAPFIAAFNYTPPYNCANSWVQFHDSSTGIVMPNSWQWDLGNGSTSALASPNGYYNAITSYNVSLIVQNSKGCKDTAALVLPVYPYVIASINAPLLECTSNTVSFSTVSVGGGHVWDFGVNAISTDTASGTNPFYTYPDSGVYTVQMILNPGAMGSCSDTAYASVQVYAPFHAGFKYAPAIVCPGYPITFTDTSHGKILPNQWHWDFGDGATSTLHNPTHAYATSGNYNVKLFIQNSKGCMDSIVSVVTIHAPVPANFGIIAPTLSCSNTVQFQSTIVTNSYLWNFGEAASAFNTSTSFNPSHLYALSGGYNVMLIVYPGTGCADTATQLVNVEFGLVANFSTQNVCVYDSAVFHNLSVGGAGTINNCKWYFGDGDSSITLQNILKHKYAVAGTYNVHLKVTNTWGCEDSITKQITVNPVPIINASPDATICNLDTLQLIANNGSSYLWTPNYDISNVNIPNPRVTPDSTTEYFVHVVTAVGCSGNDSVLITNNNPPSDGVILNTTLCWGDSVHLQSSGGVVYKWLPTVGLSNPNIANPFAFPLAYTTYVVRISTGNCVKYDTVKLGVKPLAVPDAGGDITICQGHHATLYSSGGTYFTWTPSDNHISFTNSSQPVVYPNVTTTYTLTVVDTSRCLKPMSDSMVVFVENFKGANAGVDTSTIKGYEVQLAASGGLTYRWQPNIGLSDTAIANPMCLPPHDMYYVVYVTSPEGCIDQDTVHVTLYDGATIYIPNAFTPNGDGIDDEFLPIYAGVATIQNFAIYNRWGNQVFQTTKSGEGWDGKYKGVEQEIGDYVWYIQAIDVTGAKWVKQGNVALIR